MKHMMRYQGFTPEERQDEILDKISKYGITSLTSEEKDFLDSFSQGKQIEAHQKLTFLESEIIFEDDNGLFKFELIKIKEMKNKKYIFGTLYVPDLITESGKRINGRLKGKIVDFGGGKTSPDFNIRANKKTYDIFEFCSGIEYELDSFVDYIVGELEKHGFGI